MGARDARRLVIYEVINECKMPAVFHSGHSGISSGMRCGGSLRLGCSNPMHLDDVAIRFPDMQIIIAHPSFPWQDEALSVAMHKPNRDFEEGGGREEVKPGILKGNAVRLLGPGKD
jgi:predicted TIM-barrel fold metal-dependent hydrolase